MTREQKNTLAIHLLDLFTKTWCIKSYAYEREFECINCEFQDRKGYCMVKRFAQHRKNESTYPMEDFGSMV